MSDSGEGLLVPVAALKNRQDVVLASWLMGENVRVVRFRSAAVVSGLRCDNAGQRPLKRLAARSLLGYGRLCDDHRSWLL